MNELALVCNFKQNIIYYRLIIINVTSSCQTAAYTTTITEAAENECQLTKQELSRTTNTVKL